MAQITLTVNGKAARVSVEPDTPLLYVLRNDLGLNSPRFGCGLAQCGACSVLVGGREMRSCVLPVGRVNGEVVTLEGLGSGERLHPLQRAFIAEQACQCGYCGSGMVMAAKALLDTNPRPTPAEVRQALNGHLCRCASHNRILRAVERAARELRAGSDSDPIAAGAHPFRTAADPTGPGTAGGTT
jgi:nicotinate dehydrogenase subunit A